MQGMTSSISLRRLRKIRSPSGSEEDLGLSTVVECKSLQLRHRCVEQGYFPQKTFREFCTSGAYEVVSTDIGLQKYTSKLNGHAELENQLLADRCEPDSLPWVSRCKFTGAIFFVRVEKRYQGSHGFTLRGSHSTCSGALDRNRAVGTAVISHGGVPSSPDRRLCT